MIRYGAFKSTEFTKRQIGVIYAKAKKGELKVEKWLMSELYDLADYYGYDDNGSVEWAERSVKIIINKVFDNALEEAQRIINNFTESQYETYSEKYRSKFDRTYIG